MTLEAAEQDTEAPSLANDDDSIAANWEEILAKHSTPDDDVPADAAKAAPDVEEKTEKPAQAKDRARDETGKFAKQAATPDAETPGADSAAATAPADADTASTDQALAPPSGVDITRPPSSWRPSAKAVYANLPPEIKAEVHKREMDFSHGRNELIRSNEAVAEKARLGERIEAAAQPYQALIASSGANTESAFQEMLRQHAVLRMGSPQDKVALVGNAIRQFGIDVSQLGAYLSGQPVQAAQQPQQQQPQQFYDPRVDEWLRAQEQQREQSISTTINEFLNEKDSSGQPAHLYAENVIDQMAAILPTIRALPENAGKSQKQLLEAAYESAIWANPEIRNLLMQKQQQDFEAKRQADTRTQVISAKKAASVNVPRRAAVPAKPPVGTMDQTIAETARELGFIT